MKKTRRAEMLARFTAPMPPVKERMAAVARNLLRAAVAELLAYPETPRAVVINEALEIARKFSSPESVHFVNGVLDSVGKELESKVSSQDSGVSSQ